MLPKMHSQVPSVSASRPAGSPPRMPPTANVATSSLGFKDDPDGDPAPGLLVQALRGEHVDLAGNGEGRLIGLTVRPECQRMSIHTLHDTVCRPVLDR